MDVDWTIFCRFCLCVCGSSSHHMLMDFTGVVNGKAGSVVKSCLQRSGTFGCLVLGYDSFPNSFGETLFFIIYLENQFGMYWCLFQSGFLPYEEFSCNELPVLKPFCRQASGSWSLHPDWHFHEPDSARNFWRSTRWAFPESGVVDGLKRS